MPSEVNVLDAPLYFSGCLCLHVRAFACVCVARLCLCPNYKRGIIGSSISEDDISFALLSYSLLCRKRCKIHHEASFSLCQRGYDDL